MGVIKKIKEFLRTEKEMVFLVLLYSMEEFMLILLALKWNLYKIAFSSVKTKTNPNFAVKRGERSNHAFLLSILMNHIFQTSVLFNT